MFHQEAALILNPKYSIAFQRKKNMKKDNIIYNSHNIIILVVSSQNCEGYKGHEDTSVSILLQSNIELNPSIQIGFQRRKTL